MPTAEYFKPYPPFPSDVPVVSLSRISLEALKDNNTAETEKLFQACQEWGFFLLDLRGSSQGTTLLELAEKMFDLTTELSALDQATLDLYSFKDPDFTRYKSPGKIKTVDGKSDHTHLYSLSQDEVLENSSIQRSHPDVITRKQAQIRSYIEHSHAVLTEIQTKLSMRMGIDPQILKKLNPLDQQSDTVVRLLWTPAQPTPDHNRVTFGGHTDIGTMTILFNIAGGLQVLPAGSENTWQNWRYVKPEVGCAVVNIGDTMVEWTGGLLRSSLHRVVTPPGEQAGVARRSVAYLVRAKQDASLRRVKGGIIPELEPGEEEETRSASEWYAWRSQNIVLGQLKPQTRGGRLTY
ncbi:oxidoreductase [Aspergillus karnatakaensis]|uniref:oxidoreductase n=1 Tax=Aspergillus karnatakaensis TaxID=1810916 RepID=UPI003CCD0D70